MKSTEEIDLEKQIAALQDALALKVKARLSEEAEAKEKNRQEMTKVAEVKIKEIMRLSDELAALAQEHDLYLSMTFGGKTLYLDKDYQNNMSWLSSSDRC